MGTFGQSVFSRISFVIGAYWPTKDNILCPEKPGRCPRGTSGSCRTTIKSRRLRKCGPPFPLFQFFCQIHKVSFTVYPPGWVPFGRSPWLPLTEDGRSNDEWDKTYFAGILDMSDGQRWAEECSRNHGTRRTQGRHINAICRLFSLETDDQEVQHKTAEDLGVEVLRIQDLANGIREGPSLRKKAMGVRAILDSIKTRVKTATNPILHLGHKRCFWGPPLTENCG